MDTSFNGAASRRTRMREARTAAFPTLYELQRSRVTTDADARAPDRREARGPGRFNGAASRRTRMLISGAPFVTSYVQLQRSRVTTDADARLGLRRAQGEHSASTEPRHDGRGCAGSCSSRSSALRRFNGAASRRTRMRSLVAVPAATLSRFNGAASRRTRMPIALKNSGQAKKPLQRSRVTTDADARSGCARTGRSWRFNGAASRRTRMRCTRLGCFGCFRMLQRSRVTTDADARRTWRSSRRALLASTEPRHDGRGCRACRRGNAAGAIRFNGAASRRTRMLVIEVTPPLAA